jgi:hypothetical protein
MRSIPLAEVKEAVEMTTEYKVYKPSNSDTAEDELRRRAVKRLRVKAGFWTHFAITLRLTPFSL